MSPTNDNHEPVSTDDLHDRLVNLALTEVAGRQSPPDLSGRISAAHDATRTVKPKVQSAGFRSRYVKWISVAIAATLLVGTATLLWRGSKSQYVASLSADEVAAAQSKSLGNSRQLGVAYERLSAEQRAKTEAKGHANFDSTIDLIQSTVTSETWAADPSRTNSPGKYGYIISQSQSVHEPTTGASAESAPARWPQSPVPNITVIDPAGTAPATPPVESTVDNGVQLPSPYYLTDDVQYDAPKAGFTLKDRYGSLDGERDGGGRPEAIASNSTDSLMMMVTPRIIIQEEGEAQLGLQGLIAEGTGPGSPGDQYVPIVENPFIKTVGPDAVSTFSIDVDTASYTNVRQFLTQMNQLPPPDAVRIEELVNYFQYDYAPPAPSAPGSAGGSSDDAPFAAHVEVAGCPWNAEHRLARIAVKGREMDRDKRPKSNLVFLVDVSGSMDEPNKLPLVVYGLERLTKELGENDRIAIVVYASSEGLVLPSTNGMKQQEILAALGKLQAGGSTAGGAGIQLAYQIAEDNFIKGGTNRIILCTDGDFNVGVTSTSELQRLVEKKAKDTGVFLSVLGFGRGNLNDSMMESISNHGNGNYSYVDNRTEARRVLVEQLTGTLVTIAKDVKIQVEFNPAQVAGYRLIGYENRMLRTEDFNDDKKDAGEIGAGHTVTALYEIVPAGKQVDMPPVDDLKYQKSAASPTDSDGANRASGTSKELLTLKMRYKAPDGDTSKKLEWPITDGGKAFADATDDFQFASAVAGFGLLLRNSQYKGNLTFAADLELAQSGLGEDEQGYRAEFLDLVRTAKKLKGE